MKVGDALSWEGPGAKGAGAVGGCAARRGAVGRRSLCGAVGPREIHAVAQATGGVGGATMRRKEQASKGQATDDGRLTQWRRRRAASEVRR
ncbi:hypothetical protein U1Q18_002245 [Sarracenia purpurea var. burkii]